MNGLTEQSEPLVHAPASNHILPGSHALPTPALPEIRVKYVPEHSEINEECSKWLQSFHLLLNSSLVGSDTSGLFLHNACWRDLLCLKWDFHTLQGPDAVAKYVDDFVTTGRSIKISLDKSVDHRAPAYVPLDAENKVSCLQAWFTIETDIGEGRGIVKLVRDDDGQWKAYTVFTTLEELKGHEELIKERRPAGK